MSIGKRIKMYREQAGYSQKELASIIFVADRTIGHYETEIRVPPIDKLELIAEALDVELSDLVQESNKDEDEWYDYLLNNGKQSRKNMNEKRFCIIANRCFYGVEIHENDDELSCDGYVYNKHLASEILKLANNHVSFSEIWYKDSNGSWKIRGYMANKHFEIEVVVNENNKEIHFLSHSPIHPKGKFYIEFQEVLNTVAKWFSNQYRDYALNYNEDSLIHLKDTTKEEVRHSPLKSGNFSARIEKIILNNDKYNTIDKLLNVSKSEWNSIPQLGYASVYEIELFLKKVKSWLDHPEFISVFGDHEKNKKQTDPSKIPIEDTYLNIKIVNALKREGYKTLGDVCELTKWQASAMHQIDEKELKELERELKSYGLNFSQDI